jgi:hypothetical protein
MNALSRNIDGTMYVLTGVKQPSDKWSLLLSQISVFKLKQVVENTSFKMIKVEKRPAHRMSME